MKKRLALISAILALMAIVTGCAGTKKTARLAITNSYYGTMEYIPDEELEQQPEPEPVVYTVKKGDEIEGLEIVSVTDSEVKVKTYFEYYDGKNYGKVFTVKRGTTIWMTEVDLLDASHTYTITFLDEEEQQ